MVSSRGPAISIATSVVFLSAVISRNFPKVSEIFSLVVLSSFQHSLKRSQTTSVIPMLSAFSGLVGRSPEITAFITSAFLLGKNGRLPVKVW